MHFYYPIFERKRYMHIYKFALYGVFVSYGAVCALSLRFTIPNWIFLTARSQCIVSLWLSMCLYMEQRNLSTPSTMNHMRAGTNFTVWAIWDAWMAFEKLSHFMARRRSGGWSWTQFCFEFRVVGWMWRITGAKRRAPVKCAVCTSEDVASWVSAANYTVCWWSEVVKGHFYILASDSE